LQTSQPTVISMKKGESSVNFVIACILKRKLMIKIQQTMKICCSWRINSYKLQFYFSSLINFDTLGMETKFLVGKYC
jgi:hypothetical protein